MLEFLDLPRAVRLVTLLGQVAAMGVLLLVLMRQRRQSRLILGQLERLLIIARRLADPDWTAPPHNGEVFRIEDYRR